MCGLMNLDSGLQIYVIDSFFLPDKLRNREQFDLILTGK